MVNLTRIYTRTGDAGNTRLSDNAEVPKTDLRVEAYGAIDETNSNLALAVAHGGLPERVVEMLALIRNELFDVGADLSTPCTPAPSIRRSVSSSPPSTGWRNGATSSAPNCRLCVRSSCPAAAPPRPSCTSRARCADAPSGWRGGPLRSTAPSLRRNAARVG